MACHGHHLLAMRLAPDLTKIQPRLKDEDLADSILRPSRLIDKAFAQVNVITVTGKIYTGIRVAENDDEIVLRNLAQPEPITIKQADIDEVVEARTSLMPANLARQLKSRDEFNDLLTYVIEIRKR